MKENSLDSSVVLKTVKGPWHWQVWEAPGLCSAVTLPGQSYWSQSFMLRPALPDSDSFFSVPSPPRHWAPRLVAPYIIVHLHSTGHACSMAGVYLLRTEVSLVFRALWNTDTQKALISNLWNGQIREQIKEENNEWINL